MSEAAKARRFLISLTIAIYVTLPVIVWATGLRVDINSFFPPSLFAFVFLSILGPLCHWRKITSLQSIVECIGFGIMLTGPLVVCSYAAFALNCPLQDQQLLQMDRNLGIDWVGLIRFIDSHPLLAKAMAFAYRTFHAQLLFLPVVLVFSQQRARAYQLTGIYGVVCVISCVVTIWYPALGTYTDFAVDPNSLKNIDGSLGVEYLPQILAVKNDPSFILRLDHASGIISFPSVHAAVAVLCAWGGWTIRWARVPILLLEILMLSSAITEGGHYVVDLIAGMGVAGFSIAFVLALCRSGHGQALQPQLNAMA